jgi:hypothetical protein
MIEMSRIFNACKEGNITLIKTFLPLHQDYFHIRGLLGTNLTKKQFLMLSDSNEALKISVECGHLEIVKHLLRLGCDPKYKSYELLRSSTALGNLAVAKCLVKAGCNIEDHGYPSMVAAIRNGRLEVVKYLIANGCNYRARQDYTLRLAVGSCQFGITKYLISLGCDPKNRNYGSLQVCLISRYSRRKRAKIYKYLLWSLKKKDRCSYLSIKNIRTNIFKNKICLEKVMFKNNFVKKILRPTSQHIQLIFV